MRGLIDKLERERGLSKEEFVQLLSGFTPEDADYLFEKSRAAAQSRFGRRIYIRGLIEFTNYCRCDCYYCGIRRSNPNAQRYRLTPEEILECCQEGYGLGFRTFVLQGGEDLTFSGQELAQIIRSIKNAFPDCAVTLSEGERPESDYRLWREAGADRYLLRHETADPAHYGLLHPPAQRWEHRRDCLLSLKRLGYQVGSGFMVGSPFQTVECLAQDLVFLRELQPEMVGIGPFIPHKDTPFGNQPPGSLEQTVFLIGLLRLMLPDALLPATTALGTIAPDGRERGILAGANVVMPNLSPLGVRKKYMLYNDKICTGEEAAEHVSQLAKRLEAIGYQLTVDRGDFKVH